jgi:predicted DNA-binding ribbon-helix-helix protein
MSGKYRRYDMIGAINFWCSKNGFSYFTYIEKKTKAELEEIVAQYNINVDEMLFEIAKERETSQNFTQNLKEKFTETVKKGLDVFKGKIEMLESLLNDEQREKYLEYCDSQQSNLEWL